MRMKAVIAGVCATVLGVLCAFSVRSEEVAKLSPTQEFTIDYSYFSGIPSRFVRRNCSLRSADLQSSDGKKLRELIDKSKILTVKESELEVTDGGPCRTITLNAGTITRKVQWTYEHAPSGLRALADWLDTRSKEEKKP